MSPQTLEKQAERAIRQRWWLILFYVSGWFVWQLLTLEPVAAITRRAGLPVHVLQVAGFAVWSVMLILLFRFVAMMRRNRAVAGVLNDELTVANRLRCWKIGYFSLLFSLIVAVVVAAFRLADALILTQLLLMVAVSVPLLAFVWLERDTAG